MIDRKIQEVIEQYLAARKRVLELGQKFPERIGGNDNIIGRVGEFIALRFLEGFGRRPKKEESSSNPGYDLKDEKTGVKTQVKVITSENILGRTVRLAPGWDELILIELDQDYEPNRIGLLTKQDQERAVTKNRTWSRTPIVKRTMLGSKGLIGRYGKVYERDEIIRRLGKNGNEAKEGY